MSQHVPTWRISTCLVATIPSSCQTGYAKYESRWGEAMSQRQKKKRIALLFIRWRWNSALEYNSSVCVCEKPGPCIERGLPVGTMDATTPTPSPQPTSQQAFIWACTWVLQPCLAKRVCAPEQGGWVPSLNSPGALVANPPTFLRQRPTGFKSKYAVNLLIFATKHNRKKKNTVEFKKAAGRYFTLQTWSCCQVAGQREQY